MTNDSFNNRLTDPRDGLSDLSLGEALTERAVAEQNRYRAGDPARLSGPETPAGDCGIQDD